MIESYSKTLQKHATSAIEYNTKLYGVECKIYYPVEVGHYSGRHDDIEFRDEPDEVRKLLIPAVYENKKTPVGGVFDSLYEDTSIIIAPHDYLLPYLSKIVVDGPLGSQQYIAVDSESTTTTFHSLYKHIQIVPYLSHMNNDQEQNEVVDGLREGFLEEIEDIDSTLDNSIAVSSPEHEDVKYGFRRIK